MGRSYHTALRSGTNRLEIETGRWYGIEKHLRICKYCDLNEVESEQHFVMKCTRYNSFREEFYFSVASASGASGGKWDFSHRSMEEAFVLILQGTGDEFEVKIFRLFHSFLAKSFQLRNSLVESVSGRK